MTTATPTLLSTLTMAELPRIGEPWPGSGGIFAGLMRGRDGAADYLLILGPEKEMESPWQDAMDWAAGLVENDHADFVLPTRAEQAALFGNLRDQFKRDWYWSCEQHATLSAYAWLQHFGYGNQNNYLKSHYYRARAVRRLVIQ